MGRDRPLLAKAVQDWPTPTIDGNYNRKGLSPRSGDGLVTAVRQWPTPYGVSGNHGPDGNEFSTFVRRWPTPRATDETKSGPATATTRPGDSLKLAVRQWATPTSRDGKDGATPSLKVPTNALLGRQAPRALLNGEPYSSESRRLNPRFVEWLMGWPLGWTGFEPAGTEWSRWLRLWRSQLFGGD